MQNALKLSALLAILEITASHVSSGTTTIDVSNVVVQPSVKRFGVNVGLNAYFDRPLLKNLVFRNPGFEGQIYQSILRCASATSTSCTDGNTFAQWPSGFWNGASYEVIYGAARGRQGTIASSTAAGGGQGYTVSFADGGTPLGAGAFVVLRKSEVTGATAAWYPYTSGGGTVAAETSDLPPETPGRQCVRLSAQGPGQYVALQEPIDTTAGFTFLQLSGSYRVSFQAKGVGGSNSLAVTLTRNTNPQATLLSKTFPLTSSWATYAADFDAAEDGTRVGTLLLQFVPQGSSVLLDDVSLVQTNADATNTTFFSDPVVNALKTLRPGILRNVQPGYELTDTLDNQLATPFGRQRSGYTPQATQQTELQYGLHDFLELCETVGAEPWYVVPITFTTAETANLMEYLGGSASTPYGARRAALGHPAPWTSVFPTIHLELGNEAWNDLDFYGGTISDPAAYGSRGTEVFSAAKASPFYASSKFDLILGGQSVYIARNVAIHNADSQHDSLAVAPYFGGHIDSYATNEQLFGPLFAEPEMVDGSGYMRQDRDAIQSSSRPVPLSVYEVNLHTTDGSISQQALDSFATSVGAGVAVADHMLLMLRDLGIKNQCFFVLTQFAYRRRDNKVVYLWGAARDFGVTNRKRPQFYGLQLANSAIQGDLVRTTVGGDDPTWNQPLTNGVQLANAHELQTFAFVNGASHSLVLFNLSRTAARDVTFSGIHAPSGTLTRQVLTSFAITDTNENAENVRVATDTLGSFTPSQPLTLPPYSMTVLTWQTNGSGSACTPSTQALCLVSNRFRVSVTWTNPYAGGATGTGTAVPLTTDTGTFWFFDAANVELVAKVLDGRAANGHFWYFSGALTDVEYTVTLTDTTTGAVKTYHNLPRQLASFVDTQAF